MAEKFTEKKVEKHHSSKGEIHFGLEVLLFIVAIFIIWILAGGAKKPVDEKPFITPPTNQAVPELN